MKWPIVNFQVVTLKNYFQEPIYECYTELDQKLKSNHKLTSQIYGNYDGTGTDKNKSLAVYKSISESLERWSCYSLMEIPSMKQKYGLDINPTSTGFAAYPSFSPSIARTKSYLEAIERWSLTNWWLENLSITEINYKLKSPQLTIWKIHTPFENCETILMQQIIHDPNIQKISFYGFATSSSLDDAIAKALVELDRNRRAILIKTSGKIIDKELLSNVDSLNDKRLLFFSSNDGMNLFQEKIIKTLNLKKVCISQPKLLIDIGVMGPWSAYTKVWRCLFENNEPTSNDRNVFFF